MFHINTHLKIAFGDWLYLLGYVLNTNDQLYGPMHPSIFFEKAKNAKFRLENLALEQEESQIDFSHQYGNYHLSKLGFEDFTATSAGDVCLTIEKLLRETWANKVDKKLIEEAIDAINQNLHWLFTGMDEVFKLDLERMELERKKAPFATHSLFASFIACSRKNGKIVYLELGSD